MEKIIITIILDKTEITIIQTITFEFENMIHYSVFLSKKTLCNWELWNFPLKKIYPAVLQFL